MMAATEEPWVPTLETTYQEYVARNDLCGGCHGAQTGLSYIEWKKDGQHHRDGDLPSIVFKSGFRSWCKEGTLHRDGDLPARIWETGQQEWYKAGKMHRDGKLPALVSASGQVCMWYINGVCVGVTKNPPEGAVFPGQLTKAARSIKST